MVSAVVVSQEPSVYQTTVEAVMPGGTMMMMRKLLTSAIVCGVYWLVYIHTCKASKIAHHVFFRHLSSACEEVVRILLTATVGLYQCKFLQNLRTNKAGSHPLLFD